jgi:penicillin-binding protein 1A
MTLRKLLLWLTAAAAVGILLLIAALFLARAWFERDLPSVESLRQLQLSVPMKVYTRDGKLIGEFGAERRALLKFDEVPQRVVQAFLAAEDDRFFEHPGVDWQGILRAALKLAVTGDKAQGGSTITMQLARNVFLSPERSFTRKFREILLALKIERELSKKEILELYLNKIFLGERAYGVGAAALVYFGKDVKDLTLAETAVIAALPKAPSRDNPVASPERAHDRRDYVLRRMRELGYVSELEYAAAVAEPVVVHPYRAAVDVDARYVAEMVRAQLYAQFGDECYSRGFSVITTLDSARQDAATRSLRQALVDYDQRHGWRGAEATLSPELMTRGGQGELALALDVRPPVGDLIAAIVVEYTPEKMKLLTRDGLVELPKDAFKWAAFTDKKKPATGDVVRVRRDGEKWQLAQVPQIGGAFVALDPHDGGVQALVGGYDFFGGSFNRAIQARRQTGSGFKPFLYSAAMAFGFTPASVILDAPVVFDDPALESTWRPENYGGDYNGPMRLRDALVHSRNLVSIRLLMAIGVDYAREYASRFGLPIDRLPHDLTMALGSAVYTPLEMARAYSTIANGGFVIDPYFIDEIRDGGDQVVFKASPKLACPECIEMRVAEAAGPPADGSAPPPGDGTPPSPPPEPVTLPSTAPPIDRLAPLAIDRPIIWLISDIMHEVTVRGTAAKVAELGRSDLAGKTGTTNDETDAWFNGFQKNLVAIAWVGFDQPTPLGRGEVGGRAALPMWMDFMKFALKDVPQETLPRPPGLVNVRINPKNGKLAAADDPDAIFETVPQNHIPEPDDGQDNGEHKSDAQDIF